jgi:hypothetical protein
MLKQWPRMKPSKSKKRTLAMYAAALLAPLVIMGPFFLPYLLEPTDLARCEDVQIIAYRLGSKGSQFFAVASRRTGEVQEMGAANTPFDASYRGSAVLILRRGKWTGYKHTGLSNNCPKSAG